MRKKYLTNKNPFMYYPFSKTIYFNVINGDFSILKENDKLKNVFMLNVGY